MRRTPVHTFESLREPLTRLCRPDSHPGPVERLSDPSTPPATDRENTLCGEFFDRSRRDW